MANFISPISRAGDEKESVRLATTGSNITLSGLQTIDSVSTVAGDRVLVKDQSDGTQNGVYVASSGAWSRSKDADTSAKLTPGTIFYVEEGTINADSGWAITTDGTIHLGTTSITFQEVMSTKYSKTAFGTVAVSGQSNVLAVSKNDTLTLVAGTNVTLTTNSSSKTVTITASTDASTLGGTSASSYELISHKGAANGYAGLDGSALISATNLPAATTSTQGAVVLNNTTSSTSATQAATASAVKSAYDLANAALPKSGGQMTAGITFTATATGGVSSSTPTALSYGVLQSYGTMNILADTDASHTEYLYLSAGYPTGAAANGLAIGYSTFQWKGYDIYHTGNKPTAADVGLGTSATPTFSGLTISNNATISGNATITGSATINGVNLNNYGIRAVQVADTRSIYDIPFQTGAQRNLTYDFKSDSVLGLSGATYAGVLTMSNWTDLSGGYPHQLAFNGDGNMYHRLGTTSAKTVWTANTTFVATAPVQPSTSNGHYYTANAAGTSSGTEPTWPTTSGGTVQDAPTTKWVASTVYALNTLVVPNTANGFFYKATTAGTSGATEPTWPTTAGSTVVDGSVTWTAYAIITWTEAGTFWVSWEKMTKQDASGNIAVDNNITAKGGYFIGKQGQVIQSTDSWLRLNPDSSHTSGVYAGSTILRTDGTLQVGASGASFNVNSSSLTHVGSTTHKTSTNATTGFQVQNSAGTTVFDVDTANTRVGIGTVSPVTALDVRGGITANAESHFSAGTYSDPDSGTSYGLKVSQGIATDKLKVAGNATVTGSITSTTPATSDNSTTVATTAFVKNQGYLTSSSMSSSTDTVITSPVDGNFLRYSSASSKWVNVMLAVADIPSLTLSKISDAGSAASKNVGTANGNIPQIDSNGKLPFSITGNAVTATSLATARSIALSGDVTATGVNFDGSANITLTTSIASATTAAKGLVQLTDSVSSTSTTTAATPNSVKQAYDLANAALPASGGSVAGNVNVSGNVTLSNKFTLQYNNTTNCIEFCFNS